MKGKIVSLPKLEDLKVAVIGLGYVGLPLAVALEKIFPVIGFDQNFTRIRELKMGNDTTLEVHKSDLESTKQITFSSSLEDIETCNCFIIAVPTPIRNDRTPDLNALRDATQMVGKAIKNGDIVIYESTVYPGCTEEECVPILEKESKLIFNINFFCGYSPERINPGDKHHRIEDIIKITSGSTHDSAELVDRIYKKIIKAGTYKAEDIKTAEAAKVIENTQRDLNIALVNEIAIICNSLNLNTQSVLKAAGTKWNFIPFKPGLVGGHCIGVDPYYLTFKSEMSGYKPTVILAGRQLNDNMATFITKQIFSEAKKRGMDSKGLKILIMGLSFKENCPDIRNSKVFNLIELFVEKNCKISVWDPVIGLDTNTSDTSYTIVKYNELETYDVIINAVAHDQFKLLTEAEIIKLKQQPDSIVYDVKSCLKSNVVDMRL